MDDESPYPSISPTNFELIVIRTGLPESILAAAASLAGKTVLQLDPNPFYGSHYSSLPLNHLPSFLHPPSPPFPQPDPHPDYHLLSTRHLYSDLHITSYSDIPLLKGSKFSIDLVGPRVLFCADQMIDLILKTEVNQYMEFKGIDGSYVGDGEGRLENVPDSRSAIFKDKKLSLQEKNRLMRFFRMVKEHVEGEQRIADKDLEMSFMEFLKESMGLSKKLREYSAHLFVSHNFLFSSMGICQFYLVFLFLSWLSYIAVHLLFLVID